MNGSDELVGLTLDDRYRLDALLGEGGMGRVYRATQLAVSRNVAVKVLHKKFARDSTVASRFLREAEVVSELTHPNIVTLVDYGTDRENGLVYLVMEMVDGLDLTSLLQDYRCGPSLGIEILDQLCAALTEPHREEIIHRDLKPDNVMVQTVTDGSVQTKILDFGIARVVRAQTRLTQTDTPCGTPSYMSPEQVRSKKIDQRTDLYALGVIMFELLTGRRPFSGGTGFEVMLGHIQRDPPRIRDLNPAVSEDFEALVADLLEKKREDRPEDVNAVRRRIERLRETGEYERIRIDPDLSVQEALEPWLEEDDGSVEESVSTNPRDEESLEAVRGRLESKVGNTALGQPEVRPKVSVGSAKNSIGPAEATILSSGSDDPEVIDATEGGSADGGGFTAASDAETISPEPADAQPAWALRRFFNRTRSMVAAAVLLVSGVTIGLVLSVGGWAEAESPSEQSAEGESEGEALAEREEPKDEPMVDRAEERPSQKAPSVGVESPAEEGDEAASETDDSDEEEPEEVAESGAEDEHETGGAETDDSETGDEESSVAAASEEHAPSAAGGSGNSRARQEGAGRGARKAGGRAADSRSPSPSSGSESDESGSGEEESDDDGFQVLPVEP